MFTEWDDPKGMNCRCSCSVRAHKREWLEGGVRSYQKPGSVRPARQVIFKSMSEEHFLDQTQGRSTQLHAGTNIIGREDN